VNLYNILFKSRIKDKIICGVKLNQDIDNKKIDF